MKGFMRILVALIVAVLTVNSLPAYADRGGGRGGGGHFERGGGNFGHEGGHWGGGFYFGPGWWGPGWGGYPYDPYYYPYPYYASPPVVVQEPPEIYVQPAPQAVTPTYWYFCPDPQGYYPYVKKCPKGWMKVVPPENGPEGEE